MVGLYNHNYHSLGYVITHDMYSAISAIFKGIAAPFFWRLSNVVGRDPTSVRREVGLQAYLDNFSGGLSDCSIFHVAWLHLR